MNYVMFPIKLMTMSSAIGRRLLGEKVREIDDDDFSRRSCLRIQPPHEAILGSIIKSIIMA